MLIVLIPKKRVFEAIASLLLTGFNKVGFGRLNSLGLPAFGTVMAYLEWHKYTETLKLYAHVKC